jgi:transitional endoplasmic reticulum ATPase
MGETPPELVSVATGPNETELVPMGRFTLPSIAGYVETSIQRIKKGQVAFMFKAVILRKHEGEIRAILARTKELLVTESVYRGKAFKLRINTDDGERDAWAMPKFLPLSKVKPRELVFSDEVQEAISTSLFTPVEHTEQCRGFKIPLKRGVLLYGPYGTGKTLAAHVTAKKCIDNGWTFLYCERADELAEMVKLAHQYQPSVVFCEDIDRAVSGERSVEMDDILNIIDGIESKGVELMVILTTNHVENLNRALLRPGRLDAVINVLPPDAKAVEKLLRIYGRNLIPENANLSQVGEVLQGTIPAVIRECAERAKLAQLSIGVDADKLIVTPEALLRAAKSMKNQLDLLAVKEAPKNAGERLGEALQEVVRHAHNGDLDEIKETVQEIRKNL